MEGLQLEFDFELDQIEGEITQLLTQNESNWKKIAKLAVITQDNKLYAKKFSSFTAWVNHIAKKCDRRPSLIWRYIKASRYFLQQIESDDVTEIDKIKAAPEALERLEKVERQAPLEVFEKLKEKVFDGSATVAECREVEKNYRPEKKQSANSESEDYYSSHLEPQSLSLESASVAADANEQGYEQQQQVHEGQQEGQKQREASFIIARSQIAPAIRQSLEFTLVDWSAECSKMRYPPLYHKTHSEVRVNINRQRRRFDLVAVIRWSFKRPKDLFIIEIKSCLQDFQADKKWLDYVDFCNYFCFACPNNDTELKKAIANSIPKNVGLIGVNLADEIQENLAYPVNVIKLPVRQNSTFISSIYETLYERALGWSGADDYDDEMS